MPHLPIFKNTYAQFRFVLVLVLYSLPPRKLVSRYFFKGSLDGITTAPVTRWSTRNKHAGGIFGRRGGTMSYCTNTTLPRSRACIHKKSAHSGAILGKVNSYCAEPTLP